MSIEERIIAEFEQHSKSIASPPILDARMMALYKNHKMKKEGS